MTEREPQQGDKIVVTMKDNGYECSEFVGLDGTYPSRAWVEQGITTVEITEPFEGNAWSKTHRYNSVGYLVLKENSDV